MLHAIILVTWIAFSLFSIASFSSSFSTSSFGGWSLDFKFIVPVMSYLRRFNFGVIHRIVWLRIAGWWEWSISFQCLGHNGYHVNFIIVGHSCDSVRLGYFTIIIRFVDLCDLGTWLCEVTLCFIYKALHISICREENSIFFFLIFYDHWIRNSNGGILCRVVNGSYKTENMFNAISDKASI